MPATSRPDRVERLLRALYSLVLYRKLYPSRTPRTP